MKSNFVCLLVLIIGVIFTGCVTKNNIQGRQVHPDGSFVDFHDGSWGGGLLGAKAGSEKYRGSVQLQGSSSGVVTRQVVVPTYQVPPANYYPQEYVIPGEGPIYGYSQEVIPPGYAPRVEYYSPERARFYENRTMNRLGLKSSPTYPASYGHSGGGGRYGYGGSPGSYRYGGGPSNGGVPGSVDGNSYRYRYR